MNEPGMHSVRHTEQTTFYCPFTAMQMRNRKIDSNRFRQVVDRATIRCKCECECNCLCCIFFEIPFLVRCTSSSTDQFALLPIIMDRCNSNSVLHVNSILVLVSLALKSCAYAYGKRTEHSTMGKQQHNIIICLNNSNEHIH